MADASVVVLNIEPYIAATGDMKLLIVPLTNLFNEVVRLGEQYSREEAPEVTGRLRKSIRGKITRTGVNGPTEAQINQDERTYWGKYVLMGAPPHVIRPRRAKALFWDNPPGPRAMVNHPGQKANPFFDRAAQRLEREIDGSLAAKFDADLTMAWLARTGP